MSYNETMPEFSDKICLYFLIENNIPYYVGVTNKGKLRYSKEKKSHMEIIEYHDNRVSANEAEIYWIGQLTAWGFSLKNKDKKAKLLPSKEGDFIYKLVKNKIILERLVTKRYKIKKEQDEKLMEIEKELGISSSAMVRLALNIILPKLRDEGFKYGGIKELWDRNKF